MAQLNGEVWFKLDSATEEGRFKGEPQSPKCRNCVEKLACLREAVSNLDSDRTIELDGKPPSEKETQAYLAFLENAKISSHALGRRHALRLGKAFPAS